MKDKKEKADVVVLKIGPLHHGHYQVVFGDGAGNIYELEVHEKIMLDNPLVVGKALDEWTFQGLKESKDELLAYRYALGLLTRRMYTEKEMRQKLVLRKTATSVIEKVVTKLFKLELLNDQTYARLYLEHQVEIGKKSKNRMIECLRQKGVSATIIDELMTQFDQASENTLIVKEIEKAYKRYSGKGLNDFEVGHKVVQALGRKGFEMDEVRRKYGFFIEDLAVNRDE